MKKLIVIFTFVALVIISGYGIWLFNVPRPPHGLLDLAIAMPTKNLEVVFLGDTGTGKAEQYEVSLALENHCKTRSLQAIVLLGDNFYPKGVTKTNDAQWQSKFEEPYDRPCLRKTPFYAVLGNHDYKGNSSAQLQFKSKHNNWNMPNRFYTLNFGDSASVTAIDTTFPDMCGSAKHCSLDFLRRALVKNKLPIQIIVGHHPVTATSGKSENSLSQALIKKLVCQRKIFYISAHSHHLEHRREIGCASEFFISGGGGASLSSVRAGDPKVKFAQSKHGFLALSLNQQKLKMSFYDTKLNTLYTYTPEN